MTIRQLLGDASKSLARGHIEDAALEAEVLLRHVLGVSRVYLYSSHNQELSPEKESSFWQLVERRLSGEPSAYITHHREFYGLDFYVDNRVLIPRPETETLVERAIGYARNHSVHTVVDAGTGCGAIAISLAVSLPEAKIYATDISASALEVARLNCQRHRVGDRVSLLHGNMLDPLTGTLDLIVANLPYIATSDLGQVNTVNFEPSLALDGGMSGLEKIYELCREAGSRLSPGGYMILEIGQGQSDSVVNLMLDLFPLAKVEVVPDLRGINRVVSLSLNLATAMC